MAELFYSVATFTNYAELRVRNPPVYNIHGAVYKGRFLRLPAGRRGKKIIKYTSTWLWNKTFDNMDGVVKNDPEFAALDKGYETGLFTVLCVDYVNGTIAYYEPNNVVDDQLVGYMEIKWDDIKTGDHKTAIVKSPYGNDAVKDPYDLLEAGPASWLKNTVTRERKNTSLFYKSANNLDVVAAFPGETRVLKRWLEIMTLHPDKALKVYKSISNRTEQGAKRHFEVLIEVIRLFDAQKAVERQEEYRVALDRLIAACNAGRPEQYLDNEMKDDLWESSEAKNGYRELRLLIDEIDTELVRGTRYTKDTVEGFVEETKTYTEAWREKLARWSDLYGNYSVGSELFTLYAQYKKKVFDLKNYPAYVHDVLLSSVAANKIGEFWTNIIAEVNLPTDFKKHCSSIAAKYEGLEKRGEKFKIVGKQLHACSYNELYTVYKNLTQAIEEYRAPDQDNMGNWSLEEKRFVFYHRKLPSAKFLEGLGSLTTGDVEINTVSGVVVGLKRVMDILHGEDALSINLVSPEAKQPLHSVYKTRIASDIDKIKANVWRGEWGDTELPAINERLTFLEYCIEGVYSTNGPRYLSEVDNGPTSSWASKEEYELEMGRTIHPRITAVKKGRKLRYKLDLLHMAATKFGGRETPESIKSIYASALGSAVGQINKQIDGFNAEYEKAIEAYLKETAKVVYGCVKGKPFKKYGEFVDALQKIFKQNTVVAELKRHLAIRDLNRSVMKEIAAEEYFTADVADFNAESTGYITDFLSYVDSLEEVGESAALAELSKWNVVYRGGMDLDEPLREVIANNAKTAVVNRNSMNMLANLFELWLGKKRGAWLESAQLTKAAKWITLDMEMKDGTKKFINNVRQSQAFYKYNITQILQIILDRYNKAEETLKAHLLNWIQTGVSQWLIYNDKNTTMSTASMTHLLLSLGQIYVNRRGVAAAYDIAFPDEDTVFSNEMVMATMLIDLNPTVYGRVMTDVETGVDGFHLLERLNPYTELTRDYPLDDVPITQMRVDLVNKMRELFSANTALNLGCVAKIVGGAYKEDFVIDAVTEAIKPIDRVRERAPIYALATQETKGAFEIDTDYVARIDDNIETVYPFSENRSLAALLDLTASISLGQEKTDFERENETMRIFAAETPASGSLPVSVGRDQIVYFDPEEDIELGAFRPVVVDVGQGEQLSAIIEQDQRLTPAVEQDIPQPSIQTAVLTDDERADIERAQELAAEEEENEISIPVQPLFIRTEVRPVTLPISSPIRPVNPTIQLSPVIAPLPSPTPPFVPRSPPSPAASITQPSLVIARDEEVDDQSLPGIELESDDEFETIPRAGLGVKLEPAIPIYTGNIKVKGNDWERSIKLHYKTLQLIWKNRREEDVKEEQEYKGYEEEEEYEDEGSRSLDDILQRMTEREMYKTTVLLSDE